jgi:hypothetical protein
VPALVELIATLEPTAVEPAQKEVEPLDIGTVISGLMPALLISVEPSGIVPPFKVKVEFAPMAERGGTAAVDVAPAIEEQAEAIVEANPPPSKTELVTGIELIPDPLEPAIAEDVPESPLVSQFETGAGLSPPGSISVAPSEIPVPLFDPLAALEPGMPSGDVGPKPDGVITVCA